MTETGAPRPSWATLLEASAGLGAAELFPPATRARLLHRVGELPLTSGLGLELRLRAGSDACDVSWRIQPAEAPALNERPDLGLNPRVFDICENLWVEIDDTQGNPPSVGFFFDRKGLPPSLPRGEELSAALRQMHQGELGQTELAEWDALATTAPETARLHYCGVLGPNRAAQLRYCFAGVDPPTILQWLERQGRRLDTARLLPFLKNRPWGNRMHWNHDCGCVDGHGSVSFEAAFTSPSEHGGWSRVFDELAGKGLASREKIRALLAWPGDEQLPLADGSSVILGRRINHLKVTVGPDGRAEAKVYLYCGWVATRPREAQKPKT